MELFIAITIRFGDGDLVVVREIVVRPPLGRRKLPCARKRDLCRWWRGSRPVVLSSRRRAVLLTLVELGRERTAIKGIKRAGAPCGLGATERVVAITAFVLTLPFQQVVAAFVIGISLWGRLKPRLGLGCAETVIFKVVAVAVAVPGNIVVVIGAPTGCRRRRGGGRGPRRRCG